MIHSKADTAIKATNKVTKQKQLAHLYAELEKKAGTLLLTKTAKDIVPGEGSVDAKVLLIGEAPGAQEQQDRRPFVGRSGQLLRKTLIEIGLPLEEVYIANIVKARPPDNRDPSPQEIKQYEPYLDREIEILDPLLIVTLGRLSMGKFLPKVTISQVHGQPHTVVWQGKMRSVLPMYHPAAALRGTKIKNTFIADMKKIIPLITVIKGQQLTSKVKEDTNDILF
jgi:DNA polymerase